jgi:hypothetical protein
MLHLVTGIHTGYGLLIDFELGWGSGVRIVFIVHTGPFFSCTLLY